MDAITTTSAHDLSLEQCDELLIQGICNIRDAVLGYTLHGLTQTQISDRVKGLGLKGSVRTIGRHVADLRAEGLLPAVGESERTQYRRKADAQSLPNGQNGRMAVQPTTTDTTNVIPLHPAPTPQQHCVPDDVSSTVVYPDVLPAVLNYEQQQGHADYLEAGKLLDQLAIIFERNAFQPRMHPDHWRSLHGGLRGLVETAEVQTRYSARFVEG